jgi:hypothetical protein
VHPQELDPEIFELEEFLTGSQYRKKWLPDDDPPIQPTESGGLTAPEKIRI